MKSLVLILLLCISVLGQEITSLDGKVKFFIYKDSVFRSNNIVLFTAKVSQLKTTNLDLVLANCKDYYYMVITSQRNIGKNTEYFTPKNPKRLLATKDSAMQLALEVVCK